MALPGCMEFRYCLSWMQTRLSRLWRTRRRSAGGQAIFEYVLLLLMLGLLAAVIYRMVAPKIEDLLTQMAQSWIAQSIAGE